uniref:Protein YLS9-like n=1 Tax=Nelumbo nucifera TaxID=4432 RepID=A0A822ZV68_NELNU|nr:TPA_asm: hypothetical protein HUJ06_018337 [Nelumbo nucifera]
MKGWKDWKPFLFICVMIIIGLGFIFWISYFIFWLLVHPKKVECHVVNASFVEFNQSTDGMLHYNLALNMSLRNPNNKLGIYYSQIEGNAYFHKLLIGNVTLIPFHQGHNNTSILNPVFKGESPALQDTSQLDNFNAEKTAGIFQVEVELLLRTKYRVGFLSFSGYDPEIKCELGVPLVSKLNLTKRFPTTKCNVVIQYGN